MKPLHRRLTSPVQYPGGFAYHVTHGIRLPSIAKNGLVSGYRGVQHDTGRNWFSLGAAKENAYGHDIVSGHKDRWFVRAMCFVEGGYFQGVAVLRAPEHYLRIHLEYSAESDRSIAGAATVPADMLELFVDQAWSKLPSVVLPPMPLRWFWFRSTFRKSR